MGSVEFFCLQSNVGRQRCTRFVNVKKGSNFLDVFAAIGSNQIFTLSSTSDLLIMIGATKGSACVRHATTFFRVLRKIQK